MTENCVYFPNVNAIFETRDVYILTILSISTVTTFQIDTILDTLFEFLGLSIISIVNIKNDMRNQNMSKQII